MLPLGRSASHVPLVCCQHVIEKEELRLHLQASKDAQRQLTMEVTDTSFFLVVQEGNKEFVHLCKK